MAPRSRTRLTTVGMQIGETRSVEYATEAGAISAGMSWSRREIGVMTFVGSLAGKTLRIERVA